jgi:hypothetical protein
LCFLGIWYHSYLPDAIHCLVGGLPFLLPIARNVCHKIVSHTRDRHKWLNSRAQTQSLNHAAEHADGNFFRTIMGFMCYAHSSTIAEISGVQYQKSVLPSFSSEERTALCPRIFPTETDISHTERNFPHRLIFPSQTDISHTDRYFPHRMKPEVL